MTRRPDRPAADRPPPAADDAIIGRAFWWSLAVIGVGAAGIGLVWWLGGRPTALSPPVEPAYVPPQRHVSIEAPALPFTDITAQAGIEFIHVNGAYGDKLLPETMGGCCAFLDFDADGDQDLLLVNSSNWPWRQAAEERLPTLALYRNDGSGTFTDVTLGSGLYVSVYGMGAAVSDYDNDDHVDIFITAVGQNHLFRNVGGRFTDVTAQAGVAGEPDAWSTAAAFVDIDNDGDLDLAIGNYVRWSKDIDLSVDHRLDGIGRAFDPPTNFEGSHSSLYRNEGDGTFSDISELAGIQVVNPSTGTPMGKALGLAPIDVDRDGWIDLVVANDTVRNFFFHNRGGGLFEEVGASSGLAFDRDGNATGAIGIDAALYRNDHQLGFFMGNFAGEMTSLYDSQLPSLFADEAIVAGIGAATRLVLTFGLFLFDADLDGRLDLLQTNGHLEEDINVVQPSQHYPQSAQLFWNAGPESAVAFVPLETDRTADLARPIVGRGAAYADIDGDGDLDIILTQIGARPLLFRNDLALGHHWLRTKLVGRGDNRLAIVAWIELTAGGITQRRHVMPTRSSLSQVELPVTFGLGHTDRIDSLKVEWPNGTRQELSNVPGDSLFIINQPEDGDG